MAQKQIVVFQLENEMYGLDISNVREIIREVNITKIPKMPYSVEGIINLRGKVIPVVDLKKKFDLGASKRDAATRIIISEFQDNTVGFIVDKVLEVTTIEEDNIQKAPTAMSIDDSFIQGVVEAENGLIIILKLEATII